MESNRLGEIGEIRLAPSEWIFGRGLPLEGLMPSAFCIANVQMEMDGCVTATHSIPCGYAIPMRLLTVYEGHWIVSSSPEEFSKNSARIWWESDCWPLIDRLLTKSANNLQEMWRSQFRDPEITQRTPPPPLRIASMLIANAFNDWLSGV